MSCRAWIPAGFVGLMIPLLQSAAVPAAEVRIIGSTGVASVVSELGRQFEAGTGPQGSNRLRGDCRFEARVHAAVPSTLLFSVPPPSMN